MSSVTTAQMLSFANSTIVHFFQSGKHALIRGGVCVAAAIAPRMVLARATALFTTPPRFRHTDAEMRLLAGGERLHVRVNNGRLAGSLAASAAETSIAAWRFGNLSHPCVVLCHGWGGRGAQLRAFVAPLIAAGFQVVTFDHIGHGMSAGQQATLPDFWRGLEAVWDNLTERGIHVEGMIGHSLGGAAIASALRRPLTRLFLNTPTPRVVLIAPPDSLINYSRRFVRYFGIPERIRAAMQWRFEQRYGVPWTEFELPHSVATIRAPALFIHDRDDRETRATGSEALAREWRDARFRVTRELGHRRILRDRATIQAAIDFLGDTVEFQRPAPVGERSPFEEPAPFL